jgi:hypothetical protein
MGFEMLFKARGDTAPPSALDEGQASCRTPFAYSVYDKVGNMKRIIFQVVIKLTSDATR